MKEDEKIIREFYTCFQRLDWQGMQRCYTADVAFYDPVFENLEGEEVKGMWEMLLKSSRDLRVEFSDIQSDDDGYGSCRWVATYTFSRTGRRVVNKVSALFRCQDGKIAEHQDLFGLWKWSRQALGIPGIFFGWTPFLHKKIRAMARTNLDRFLTRDLPGNDNRAGAESPEPNQI
jgi:ketosteroid isomerase-like protein